VCRLREPGAQVQLHEVARFHGRRFLCIRESFGAAHMGRGAIRYHPIGG
jgi:hypothetical protein